MTIIWGNCLLSQLPAFPQFAPVTLAQRELMLAFAGGFQVYSDFSHTSLLAWDFGGRNGLARLNGNLVVRFYNAELDRTFFSFMGRSRPNETATILLEGSASLKLPAELRLVPEETARLINVSVFLVSEERDNFDYVFDAATFADYSGPKFAEKRRLTRKLMQKGPISAERLNWVSHEPEVRELCASWLSAKSGMNALQGLSPIYGAGFNADVIAMLRAMEYGSALSLITIGLRQGGALVAVVVGEVCQRGVLIVHFIKSDLQVRGSSEVALQAIAREAIALNCYFINFQEDLGIPTLRDMKQRLRPITFAKKYKIHSCVGIGQNCDQSCLT